MHIKAHHLHDTNGDRISYQASPNRSGTFTPRYLIVHYTAGASAESSIRHLFRPQAKASAHLVIAAALSASEILCRHYGLVDVLGHDDIAPSCKLDPGPAFPMAQFQSQLIGRADDAPDTYETTSRLNIRSGPGADFEKLEASPLPKGTQLHGDAREGNWHHVEVLDETGEATASGWVHGNYIKPAPQAA